MKPKTKTTNTASTLKASGKERVQQDLDSILRGSRDRLSKPAERYANAIVDPKGAKETRVPTLIGGYSEATSSIKVKSRGQVAVGTGGYGFIVAGPTAAGPMSDCSSALYTTAAYNGTGTAKMPGGPIANVPNALYTNAPFKGADALAPNELQFRTVASAIYITPTGSATSQNGMIYLLETPGHDEILGTGINQTLAEITAHDRTRTIRGVQTGDPSCKNVLNWHPMMAGLAYTASNQIFAVNDDLMFRGAPQLANTAIISGEMFVIVTGTVGATYDFELVTMYEIRGSAAGSKKPCFYDQRGFDLVLNGLGSKVISGWVGTPHEAERAYHHAITEKARKERALDAPDQRAADKQHDSPWWKDLIHLSKQVAGFIL